MGFGGVGKFTLGKLTSYMLGYSNYEIEIVKQYKEVNWKDDLRRLIKISACKSTNTTFLLKDTQILQEKYYEDIS
jgi:dynein heavy chain